MLPLTHALFWRIAGLTLLLLVLTAALMPAGWFWDDKADILTWFRHTDKVLHGMTFFFLTVWFSGQYQRNAYFSIAAALVLFGLLIEFCQSLVGYRSADWLDMAANTTGVAIGLAVAIAGLGGWSQRVEDWYTARDPGSGVG